MGTGALIRSDLRPQRRGGLFEYCNDIGLGNILYNTTILALAAIQQHWDTQYTVTLPKSPHRRALAGTLFTTIVVHVNIILPVLLELT
jgi:hypothetical protein